MNLFDVSDEDYVHKSKIRAKDSSLLAQKLQTEFAYGGEPIQVILDIGCGTGYSTLELSARFPNVRVIGVDTNPSYIERAPLMTKNVEFYCVDISESENFANFCTVTDLSESSVNIAISTYWLTGLSSANKAHAITNIGRLLRPNGFLYILDLIWTDAYPVIYRLNQMAEWEKLIKQNSLDTTTYKLPLPQSESPPSNEQISNTWIEQFASFDMLELYQIALNNRNYRFQSMHDMFQVLESICATLNYIDEDQCAHKYFVDFVRCTFDDCLLASREMRLGYKNVLVVAVKKQ